MESMRPRLEVLGELKIRLFLAGALIFGLMVLGGTYPGRGAGTGPAPRVTAIRQITHDGYPKAKLVADGSELYVNESRAADRIVAKVILRGSARSVLDSPFPSLEALDLSPDHSRLLVSSKSKASGENEFWTLPLGAGSAERLGVLSGRDASWSSDGKRLAFAQGSTLYLSNAQGSEQHAVWHAPGSIFGIRFAPDGQRIRFTVSDPELNSTTLWEVERDGMNPHALLSDWPLKSVACCGSWTPDGRYYIFQAAHSIPNTSSVLNSLWALPEGTSIPVALTNGPISFGGAATGGDGNKIWAIGVQPSVDVVKYEARKKKFVPVIPDLSATDLDFSKDGKWVTYVAIPDGTLWRARADGSRPLQLTSGAERAALPKWSPDGKQIAYVSLKPGESWKLYLISSQGGVPEPLVEEAGSQIDANWSADGTRLMYGDFAHDSSGLSIRILNLKTRSIEKVPGSDGLFSPRWSPDGRYVAALSPDSTALMLFDSGTREWAKWFSASGAVNYPVWSADSKYLYFDDLIDGAESIRRLKVGESQAQSVVEVGTMDRYTGALGIWSGPAPDGSWMFLRDHSSQEVYQLSLELP
jgi:Tol biopolymer transport system component